MDTVEEKPVTREFIETLERVGFEADRRQSSGDRGNIPIYYNQITLWAMFKRYFRK